MSVNKACIIKSFKTDYFMIGSVLGFIALAAGLAYISLTYSKEISDLSVIFSGFNLFIATELIAVFGIPIAIACDDYSKPSSKSGIKEMNTTPFVILLSGVIMVFIVLMYYTASPVKNPFPDIILFVIGFFLLNAVIVSPICVAYARCKEEKLYVGTSE